MTPSSQAVEGSIYRVQGPQTITDVERELRKVETRAPTLRAGARQARRSGGSVVRRHSYSC